MSEPRWQRLLARDELAAGDVTLVERDGHYYAVFDTPEGIEVTDARCSHAGANLCNGYFDGHFIECPLHQGLFDVRTGAALAAPATRPLTHYRSRVREGTIEIAPETERWTER